MLWLLRCLHIMKKEVDQFGLTMCIVLEMNQIFLHVNIVDLVAIVVNMINMFQLNVQVSQHYIRTVYTVSYSYIDICYIVIT